MRTVDHVVSTFTLFRNARAPRAFLLRGFIFIFSRLSTALDALPPPSPASPFKAMWLAGYPSRPVA